jgi:hypothetical protein
VSAVAIHNKMALQCPELLELLYQPYYRIPRPILGLSGNKDIYPKPIFMKIGKHFSCDLSYATIENAQKHPNTPKLSEMQVKALNMLDELAEDRELYHEFCLDAGDIIYINNRSILHARRAFEDDSIPQKKRLLLRLHLNIQDKNNEK